MPVRGSLHLFLVGLKFTDLGGELLVSLFEAVELVEDPLHSVIRVVVDEEVGQRAGQHADDPDPNDHQKDRGELADEGMRRDITVTDGGRRGDGPPERAAVRDVLTD